MALRNLTLVVVVDAMHSDLAGTLTAIEATVRDRPFEVLVAVNGSEISPAVFEGRMVNATTLRSSAPVARAVFLSGVLQHARGDVVTFLLAGCAPEPDWHHGVFELMDHPDVGAVAPRLVDPTGRRIVAAGFGAEDGVVVLRCEGYDRDAMTALEPSALFLSTIDGLSIRRELFERIGTFDAAFRESLYDFDWVLRARSEQSTIVYRPDVTMRIAYRPLVGRTSAERADAVEFMRRWSSALVPDVTPERFIP